MTSGGARTRSGPAPDPTALRRDRDHAEWIALPAGGRQGEAPLWPLPDNLAGESVLWEREWSRPQAVEWERNGQELEVALFVRAIVVSEGPKATAADRNVVQRKMNDLGLTVPGLRANRWRIGDEVVVEPKKPVRSRSARDRLKVVKNGEAAAGDNGGGA